MSLSYLTLNEDSQGFCQFSPKSLTKVMSFSNKSTRKTIFSKISFFSLKKFVSFERLNRFLSSEQF